APRWPFGLETITRNSVNSETQNLTAASVSQPVCGLDSEIRKVGSGSQRCALPDKSPVLTQLR
ncbi:MAG: hypothetical protein ACPGXX_09370, partial [Planctomycetaceae bacterium]